MSAPAIQHCGVIDRGRGDVEPVHGMCRTCTEIAEAILLARYPPRSPTPVHVTQEPLLGDLKPRPIRKSR